jgi:hypothetical protein
VKNPFAYNEAVGLLVYYELPHKIGVLNCITYIKLIAYSAIQEHKKSSTLAELVILQPQSRNKRQIIIGYNVNGVKQPTAFCPFNCLVERSRYAAEKRKLVST